MTHDARLTAAYADAIYYKSGQTLKGVVVEEHWDRVVLNTETGEREILHRDIEEIFYDDPERNYLYLGNQALGAGDFAGARGFFRKALQHHPRFQEADDALQRLKDIQKKQASPLKISNWAAALEDRWGLVIETTPRFPVVREVKKGSLAAKLKILSGDSLVSLWGESLAFLPKEKVAEILLGPPQSLVRLTIERELYLPRVLGGGQPWPAMKLGMERLGLTVLSVKGSGVAAKNGLKARDRIVTIDKGSTRYLPLTSARRVIRAAKSRGLVLVVHRDLKVKRE